MSNLTIDLSTLAAPAVVETLSFDAIVAAMLADLQARDPSFTALLDSDPAYLILQVAAYREVLLRQRINDAARGVMLAYAVGPDLDNLAALFGVTRLTLTAANPTANPPVAALMESDAALRSRVQLALDAIPTAGSVNGYLYWTKTAQVLDANGNITESVQDASISSTTPGTVTVAVLSTAAGGVPSPSLLIAVNAALNADSVRPLTDVVQVIAAQPVAVTINAAIRPAPGADAATVLASAQASLQSYLTANYKVGANIPLSGIYAALQQPGVARVDLTAPTTNISISSIQVAQCVATITNGGPL